MAIPTPDWLSKRGADFRQSKDHRFWVVYLNKEPQYLIRPVPASGKHAVEVEQSNNGKRLEGKQVYATEDDAIRGGLEDLRKVLGW
jgi:hypothetical protein